MLNYAGPTDGTVTVTQTSTGTDSQILNSPAPINIADGSEPIFVYQDPNITQPIQFQGCSVSTAAEAVGVRLSSKPAQPQFFAADFAIEQVVSIGGNWRVYLERPNFAWTGQRIANQFWRKCDFHLKRITNGTLSEPINLTPVIDASFTFQERLGNDNQYIPAGLTQAEVTVPSFGNPNGPYRWGVAGFNVADYMYGAIGYNAPYAPNSRNNPTVGTAWFNSATNITDGGSLPAPTNVTATPIGGSGNDVLLQWDPIPGITGGYIIFRIFDDPATWDNNRTWVEIDGTLPQPLVGDSVWLTHTNTNPLASDAVAQQGGIGNLSRNILGRQRTNEINLWNNNSSYRYVEFDPVLDPSPDTTVTSDYYVEFDLNSEDNITFFASGWEGSNQATNDFWPNYPVGTVGRWQFWARTDDGSVATCKFTSGTTGSTTQNFNITGAWTLIDLTDTITTQRTSNVGAWSMRYDALVNGSKTIQCTDVRVNLYDQLGAIFGDYIPPLKATLIANVFNRVHDFIKDADQGISIRGMLSPVGTGTRGNNHNTIPGFLEACRLNNQHPHLQIEAYHRGEEWDDVAAYLGAPVSSGHPMALRRQSHGQSTPWLPEFPRWIFEPGNENWAANQGVSFRGSPNYMIDQGTGLLLTTAESAGAMYRFVVDRLRASPYWDNDIEYMVSGRAGNVFSENVADAFIKAGGGLPIDLILHIGIANYTGGRDSQGVGFSTNADDNMQNIIGVTPAVTDDSQKLLRNQMLTVAANNPTAIYGVNLFATCYEAGPGYQLPNDNRQSFAEYTAMRTVGAATGSTDSFFSQIDNEFSFNNLFTHGVGQGFRAIAHLHQGQGLTPAYQLYRVMQEYLTPDGRGDSACPIFLEDLSGVWAGDDWSGLNSFFYAYRPVDVPDRVVIASGNRTIYENVLVEARTNLSSIGSVTVWQNFGDFRNTNAFPPGLIPGLDANVDGAGQTGNVLVVDNMLHVPTPGTTFDLNGFTYTVSATNLDGLKGTLTLTSNLMTVPSDGDVLSNWSYVDANGWAPNANSVLIDIQPVVLTPPANPAVLKSTDFGSPALGFDPGTCVIAVLDGCVFNC